MNHRAEGVLNVIDSHFAYAVIEMAVIIAMRSRQSGDTARYRTGVRALLDLRTKQEGYALGRGCFHC